MNSCVEDHRATVGDLSAELPIAVTNRVFFPLPILLGCLIVLVISVFAPMRIGDSDIWFHLSNARQLLSTHCFLQQDAYTFTSAGARLLNHEWLSELPYYVAFQGFGLRGLLFVYEFVLCLVFWGMYYLACWRGANCGDAALITVGAVLLGLFSSGPRMHNFGYLCLTLLLIALERFRRSGKGLWLVPPIFAVWINLHGSWVFGFVIMGIYLVSDLVKDDRGRVVAEPWKPRQLRKLLTIILVSAAALLVNPYGYRLVWYPFDLLFRQQANVRNVIEWQSVDFNSVYGMMALGALFCVLGIALLSEARWPVRDVLMVGFALWASLTHVRFLQFAAIVLIPVLAPKLRLCPPYSPHRDSSWRNGLAAAVILVLLIWGYPSSARLQTVIDQDFPLDALHYMQHNNISGRLFHFYDFGGYIEWLAPGIKTFADGRTDIFVYNGVFDDYLRINKMQQPFELLDKYKIDYILYPPGTSLSYLLDHSGGWQVIYHDPVARLYQRVPAARTVLKHP